MLSSKVVHLVGVGQRKNVLVSSVAFVKDLYGGKGRGGTCLDVQVVVAEMKQR